MKVAVKSVPFIDLKRQYQAIAPELNTGVLEVFARQHFILGEEVARLEEEMGKYLGGARALGVSSGTDALLLALMALDIAPGDEVITTPFTFFATAGVIARLGARPVFVDVDPETFNLDPGLVEKAGTPKTRVVMPVHLFGQCADMEPLQATARHRGWKLVEDACQAIGSEYHGTRAGTLGDFAGFSFFPTKNLGGAGDGGLLTTRNEQLFERARMLRTHGEGPKYYHSLVGMNGRLDALQARVVSIKLRYLERWNQVRRQHADYYDHALQGLPIKIPARRPDRNHTFHQYTILTPRRDELQRFLKDRGVDSMVYYPYPLHRQQCFASLGYRDGSCPVTERICQEVLSLPIYPELTAEEQEYTVEMIREFWKKHG